MVYDRKQLEKQVSLEAYNFEKEFERWDLRGRQGSMPTMNRNSFEGMVEEQAVQDFERMVTELFMVEKDPD